MLLLSAAAPRGAAATTATDICGPAADPCRVTRNIQITPGSDLDFGSRRLEIGNRGTLDLQSGTMTLHTGELVVEAGGALLGRGSGQDPGGTIVVFASSVTMDGNMDVSGAPGGIVTLNVTGPVTVGGSIELRSRGIDSGGGSAEIRATDVALNAPGQIGALGGGEDFGGDVDIVATGAVSLLGNINVSGGEGGTVSVTGGTVTVGANVEIKADASGSGGGGGDVTITASGVLTMEGELSANGRNGSADIGAGDGGSVDISGSAIAILRADAILSAVAGNPDGVGGEIDLASTTGAIDCQGRIAAQGTGVDGTGGGVTIDSVDDVTIGGAVDARGGRDSGGDITVLAGADIVVSQGASLDVSASSNGRGGDIDLDGAGNATIRGMLKSDGGPTQGAVGGSNAVAGCTVRIEESGRLTSLRSNGTNTLIGRDATVILGALLADAGSGRNVFRFPGPEYDPRILPGANVAPGGTFLIDTSVVPCNPVDTRTPTLTRAPTNTRTMGPSPTSTPTASRSRTPTATPVPCVGDCDSSGTVTVSDLITGVNILLGNQPVANCEAFDPDDSGTVTISELIQGVNNTLNGC